MKKPQKTGSTRPPSHRAQHDPLAPKFTRAQIEWALWEVLKRPSIRRQPRAFKVAVKHLLEFDRTYPSTGDWAFSDDPPAGRGDHGRFSVFDALMLDIGLRLLRLSFKRKEVVVLLREIRASLRRDLLPVLTSQFNLWLGHAVDNRKQASVTLILSHDFNKPFSQERELPSPLITKSTQATMAEIEKWPEYNLVLISLRQSTLNLPPLLKQAPKARRGRGHVFSGDHLGA